jgi:hypothetical protein
MWIRNFCANSIQSSREEGAKPSSQHSRHPRLTVMNLDCAFLHPLTLLFPTSTSSILQTLNPKPFWTWVVDIWSEFCPAKPKSATIFIFFGFIMKQLHTLGFDNPCLLCARKSCTCWWEFAVGRGEEEGQELEAPFE